MGVQKRLAQELADLLAERSEEILASCRDLILQVPNSGGRELSRETLQSWMHRGLCALVDALVTESHTPLEDYLRDVNLASTQASFDSSSVVECILLCKEAILPVIGRAGPDDTVRTWELFSQLDAYLHWMVKRFHEMHTVEISTHLQEQLTRMRLLLEMAITASSTLELDEVISRVVHGMAAAAGVPHCGFVLVDEEKGIISPKLDVTVPSTLEHYPDMTVWVPKPPEPITTQGSFMRQAISQKVPLTCYDAQTDPRFDQRPLSRSVGYRSVLAVPLVIQGRVVAIALGFTLKECRTFTQEQIELVCSLASVAALAIENARLHEQVKQMAVVEERNRLAREMHDTPAQMLGAVQMKASHVNNLLSRGEIAQSRAAVAELQILADEAFASVRGEIVDLRAMGAPEQTFLTALRNYLNDCQSCYKIKLHLYVTERDDFSLPWSTQVQTIRIIQEALTNVRKHSGTNEARIHVHCEGGYVHISVEDAGRGFHVNGINEPNQLSFGLQVMKERAESVGGTLVLDSHPGKGTRVVLQVPLLQQRAGI